MHHFKHNKNWNIDSFHSLSAVSVSNIALHLCSQGEAETRRDPVNGVKRGPGSLCWDHRSQHDLYHIAALTGSESGSLHINQMRRINCYPWLEVNTVIWRDVCLHCASGDWNCLHTFRFRKCKDVYGCSPPFIRAIPLFSRACFIFMWQFYSMRGLSTSSTAFTVL